MILKTIKDDEEFLRKCSIPVKFNDKNLVNEINDLKDYTLSHDVWAMASVQIGILKQIIFIKSVSADGPSEGEQKTLILINPKIIAKRGKTQFWEGCASCLQNVGLVERPYLIEVSYQDVNGKEYTKKFEGFEATVISHEYDHINGILHMDRAIEIRQLDKEEKIRLRKSEPYKIISKDCEFKYAEEI